MFRSWQLHGHLQRPAVAVIGAWDPLVDGHARLFRRLKRYSAKTSRDALAVLLWPHPGSFIGRRCDWPLYDALPVQVELIRSYGVDAVLVIRFSRRDSDLGANELFKAIAPRAKLSELWLGARQSLGRCKAGSAIRIDAIARKRGIVVRRLRPLRSLQKGSEARRSLAAGKLRRAIVVVGRPPVLQRPARGTTIFVGWRPGVYRGVGLSSPLHYAGTIHSHLSVTAHKRGTRLQWPDRRLKWLAITDGPRSY